MTEPQGVPIRKSNKKTIERPPAGPSIPKLLPCLPLPSSYSLRQRAGSERSLPSPPLGAPLGSVQGPPGRAAPPAEPRAANPAPVPAPPEPGRRARPGGSRAADARAWAAPAASRGGAEEAEEEGRAAGAAGRGGGAAAGAEAGAERAGGRGARRRGSAGPAGSARA